MGREGVPSPTIDDALQMYDGREFRSKGGGGENYYSSHPTPIQIRALGVGNVILEHHGVMRPRERVSLAGNLSL